METRDNKYLKWYWNICENAKVRETPEGYVEYHHIYPRGIYGENKDVVPLTAKEHYIVHLCLWQGLRQKYGTQDIRTRKMAYGFTMMNSISHHQKDKRIKNSSDYSFFRIAYLEANKGKIRSKETIEKWRITRNNWTIDRRKEFVENLSRKAKLRVSSMTPEEKIIRNNKISAGNKGKIRSEDAKKRYGNASRGRIHSKESREKNRLAHLGKKLGPMSEEDKKKKSLALMNHVVTEETCKKISQTRIENGLSKGENNPMYGTGGYYSVWVKKYGKEEADKRQAKCIEKRNETRILKQNLGNKNE